MKKPMDLRRGEIKTLNFKYLTSAFGVSFVWLFFPLTELVTALCAAALIKKYTAAG